MELFRIAKTRFINDLSGTGARLNGGRWNEKGTAAIYASESRALATLEYLVHLPMDLAPATISLLKIHIPDGIKPEGINLRNLPPDWKTYPAPEALADMGSGWARASGSLLLKVPSALVDEEFNFLINPNHPDFKRVKFSKPKKLILDKRLS